MPRKKPTEDNKRDQGFKKPRKHRSCFFCAEKIEVINYQETPLFRKFVSERGKINKRGNSGACAMHQRKLAQAVKRARVIGVVPYQVD